ncbi:hypothetical protein GCM10010844_29050 [Deinococcus radiotolerans]|uniref:Uncharacterized protein n=1 Tax=Deinococcus radiotolerans TaxID=1309407 RepID=A0ABQ2FL26_9DEIO|nr:hypothetical protein GCM10010844_29050 [Deinococcus radiotolerans]
MNLVGADRSEVARARAADPPPATPGVARSVQSAARAPPPSEGRPSSLLPTDQPTGPGRPKHLCLASQDMQWTPTTALRAAGAPGRGRAAQVFALCWRAHHSWGGQRLEKGAFERVNHVWIEMVSRLLVHLARGL